MDAQGDVEDQGVYQTPPKRLNALRRKARENTLSPGSLRAGKHSRINDDLMYERMHTMMKVELDHLKIDMEKKMYETMEAQKDDMYAHMRKEMYETLRDELYVTVKGEMHALLRADVNVMETMVCKKMDERLASFESWKAKTEKCMADKDALIKKLQEELTVCKGKLDTNSTIQNRATGPHLQEKMEELKSHVEKEIKSFADVTKQKMESVEHVMKENAEWIEVVKKHKGMPGNRVDVMNATLEEEARRRARALHVRVVGLEEKGSPQEDAKALATKIGASNVPIASAWRVGKGESQPKALLLRFGDMDTKRAFLSKRVALKGDKIYLNEDLTPAQVSHRREHMPKVLEARKEGKFAMYRDGRVIIMEKRSPPS